VSWYLWLKALHLVFMVSWFAGLFYLPRLFVYHALTTDEVGNARFKVMERKLYRGIMWPAAILTALSGLALIAQHDAAWWNASHWLHLKLALVACLFGYHVYLGHLLTLFAHDANPHGDVFYRWLNEVPVVVLLGVVLLAVLKPF
jgi:putative membrane protein